MNLVLPERVNKFDKYILTIIKQHIHNKILDVLMPIITALGDAGAVWIIISAYLFLSKNNKTAAEVMIITLIFSTIIGEGILKHIFKRMRPFSMEGKTKLLISKPITYSFPSGHALSSFAEAGILSIYFNQYKLLFFTLALLISLSRIYLYVHYPTDVIMGIIIGLICSKLVFIIFNDRIMQKLANGIKLLI